MGVDVSPRVMIGIYFESYEDACDFVVKTFSINEEELEQCHLCEFEYDMCNLEYQDISCYSDHGGVLGLSISESDLIQGSKIIDEIYTNLFSKIPVDYHKKIKGHIWAQYW